MRHDRRSALTALGLALPLGLAGRAAARPDPTGEPPLLRLRPFEEAVREAFAAGGPGGLPSCVRVEVGDGDEVRAGLQGCVNDRPFAGFSAGRLRIVRTATVPGPPVLGVRLYVTVVDVARDTAPGRPLDFAALPPAPTLAAPRTPDDGARERPAPWRA